MTQTVSRLYRAAADAEKAAAELMRREYSDVFLFKGEKADGETAAAKPHDTLIEAMIRAYIYKPHAKFYASRIAEGASLVTVHAPFGTAERATRILETFGPLKDGTLEMPSRSYAYNEATPLSSCLQMPVLSKTALPFEAISGLPSLTSTPRTYTEGFMSMLSGNRTPLSALLGLSTLSASATPFSAKFGLATLTACKTPLSSCLGLPLLKGE